MTVRLVSVHVPKTGGTSLRAALSQAHTVREVYRGRRQTDGEIVHGHLTAQDAAYRWPTVPIVAVIRHPYHQIRSNYDHYRRNPRTWFQPGIGRLPAGMTFEDFIEHPAMANYQCQFLNHPVAYVGVTDRLCDVVGDLNRLFGLSIPAPPRANVTRRRTTCTPSQKTLIDRLHGDDLALWDQYS